ncbi:hypothetical protein BDQ17DRAFT_748171 [Cyathus striatus]|nr:hypothetical protein BDQ17DRAFT_748171 [Cyathus striatus]
MSSQRHRRQVNHRHHLLPYPPLLPPIAHHPYSPFRALSHHCTTTAVTPRSVPTPPLPPRTSIPQLIHYLNNPRRHILFVGDSTSWILKGFLGFVATYPMSSCTGLSLFLPYLFYGRFKIYLPSTVPLLFPSFSLFFSPLRFSLWHRVPLQYHPLEFTALV